MYKEALANFKEGQVVVFPTDTVMGIGCSMIDRGAIKRLYEIKKRPSAQPTAVLVSDLKMAESLMKNKPDANLVKILKEYWPGGLTIVVEALKQVPKEVLGDNKVGIRIPDHQKLQKLIGSLGAPLVATSSNFKNESAPIKFEDISVEILKLVDYAIKRDSTGSKASTVIEYIGDGQFKYLRKGTIKVE